MRRPVTDAELERIEVTDADQVQFKRLMDKVLEQVVAKVGDRAIVGIAMMRAACQGASVMGLAPEDLARIVGYAMNTFEAHGPVQFPTDEELGGVYALSRRIAHICGAALRHDPATDTVGVQLWVAVSLLRWNGTPDDVVYRILKASIEDADKATAAHAKKHGAKA